MYSHVDLGTLPEPSLEETSAVIAYNADEFELRTLQLTEVGVTIKVLP